MNRLWAYLLTVLGGTVGVVAGGTCILTFVFRLPLESPESQQMLWGALPVGLISSLWMGMYVLAVENKVARRKAVLMVTGVTTALGTCVLYFLFLLSHRLKGF